MAEAFAVIGLVSAVTSLTETGGKILRRLKDAKNSVDGFDHIAAQLPLLLEILEDLESESRTERVLQSAGRRFTPRVGRPLDRSAGRPLLQAVQGCQRQIEQLEELLDSCLILEDDGKTKKFLKAVRATTNEKRIRSIQYTLETYKTTLILRLGRREVGRSWAFQGFASRSPSLRFFPPSIQATLSIAEHKIVKLPALQIPNFVNRTGWLWELIQALVPSDPPTVIWLHGMGAQGKTQIALECCRNLNASGHYFPTIIWIDASSKEKIRAEYSLLLNKLSGDTPPSPDIDETRDFQQRLEDWPEPFLLVFDGCDGPATLQEIKIHLPRNPNCVTLCTSRYLDSDRPGQVISVPPMSESEASELLLSRCKAERTDANVAEASQISEALGYLPLAVDQAASYIKERRLPLTTFLEHYKKRKDGILGQVSKIRQSWNSYTGEEQESLLSVFATWELTFDEFVQEVDDTPDVPLFLGFLASFQYSDIPESICRSYAQSFEDNHSWASSFIADGTWDSGKFHDFTARLAANSVITSIGFEGDDVIVSLHPFIQEWIRHRLPSPEQQPIAL